jgi:hypothetical protein
MGGRDEGVFSRFPPPVQVLDGSSAGGGSLANAGFEWFEWFDSHGPNKKHTQNHQFLTQGR